MEADFFLKSRDRLGLHDLPNEVLTDILVLSYGPSLIHTCRHTWTTLPSYTWYSRHLAALALHGHVSVFRGAGETEACHSLMRVLIDTAYSKLERDIEGLFVTKLDEEELSHAVLSSSWFRARQFELTHQHLFKAYLNLIPALPYAWKEDWKRPVELQLSTLRYMSDWEDIQIESDALSNEGSGLETTAWISISNVMLHVVVTSRQNGTDDSELVMCVFFLKLTYLPDALLECPVSAQSAAKIHNATETMFNVANMLSEATERPICSFALLREAIIEVIERPGVGAASAEQKAGDDAFAALLRLDSVLGSIYKKTLAIDEDIVRRALTNDKVLYLFQIFRTFSKVPEFEVDVLSILNEFKAKTPQANCQSQEVLRLEANTRHALAHLNAEIESEVRAVTTDDIPADATFGCSRACRGRDDGVTGVFSIELCYCVNDEFEIVANWSIEGGDEMYEYIRQRKLYGQRAALEERDGTHIDERHTQSVRVFSF